MAWHHISDLIANHRRFVERASRTGRVWCVFRGDDIIASVPSNNWFYSDTEEPVNVLLFWSDRAYAADRAKGWGAGCQVTAIELDDFRSHIEGNAADALIGPNYNHDLAGVEVSAQEMLRALHGFSAGAGVPEPDLALVPDGFRRFD